MRIIDGIANGLQNIHNNGLIHHDLHYGNLLTNYSNTSYFAYVTDLGLCQPVNVEPSQNINKKIYGVLS